MNGKSLLTLLLLVSLLLLLGGMRRPEQKQCGQTDPIRLGAESLVADAMKGDPGAWREVANRNPLWLLKINARPQP